MGAMREGLTVIEFIVLIAGVAVLAGLISGVR